jgi:hypothetical protein
MRILRRQKDTTLPFYLNIYGASTNIYAGSIPDGVIGIFYWHKPSGRTMGLALTPSLSIMSTRNISCGVKTADA